MPKRGGVMVVAIPDRSSAASAEAWARNWQAHLKRQTTAGAHAPSKVRVAGSAAGAPRIADRSIDVDGE